MSAGKILGVNKRYYPAEFGCSGLKYGPQICGQLVDPPPSVAVLVAGGADDYAVYVGHSNNPEWVARHGDKISFAEAVVQFPGIARENYRE